MNFLKLTILSLAFGLISHLSVFAQCAASGGFTTTNKANNSANLSWNAVGTATSYEVRYRVLNTNYKYLTTTGTSLNLTGLYSGTPYSWSVKTICGSKASFFPSDAAFTTTGPVSCPQPGKPTIGNITDNGATFTWPKIEIANRYVVKYRIKSTANLAWSFKNTPVNFLTLDKLQHNTDYEWVVATDCSADSSLYSLYTTGGVFKTLINPNGALAGDFRSKASENWNNFATWQRFNGIQFIDAVAGEIPGELSTVYIQDGHTITLTENASCKNLHLNTKEDVVRLNIQDYALDIWGKLRLYKGPVPGINDPEGAGIAGWISTGSTGKIRFKGAADRIVTYKEEFGDHINLKGWNIEVAFGEGVTGTVESDFRAGKVNVTSGFLKILSENFEMSE